MSAMRWLWARPWFRFGAMPTLMLMLLAVANGDKAKSAIRQAVRDPYSILNGRSPGDRDPGALFQTKLAYSRANPSGRKPHQRVLPTERVRPATGSGAPGLGDTPLGLAAPTLGPLNDSLPDFGGGAGGRPSLVGETVPSFIGGGAVPADATAPISASDVTAVPEPETWDLLMVGVGLIGFGARRRRTIRRATVAAQANLAHTAD